MLSGKEQSQVICSILGLGVCEWPAELRAMRLTIDAVGMAQAVPDEVADSFLANVDSAISIIQGELSPRNISSDCDLVLLGLALKTYQVLIKNSTHYEYYFGPTCHADHVPLGTRLADLRECLVQNRSKLQQSFDHVTDKLESHSGHSDSALLFLIYCEACYGEILAHHIYTFVGGFFRLDCPFIDIYLAGLIMRHPAVIRHLFENELLSCWDNPEQYQVMALFDGFADLPGGLL